MYIYTYYFQSCLCILPESLFGRGSRVRLGLLLLTASARCRRGGCGHCTVVSRGLCVVGAVVLVAALAVVSYARDGDAVAAADLRLASFRYRLQLWRVFLVEEDR